MNKLILLTILFSVFGLTSVVRAQMSGAEPAPATEMNTVASQDSAITINLQNKLKAENLYGTSNSAGTNIKIETRDGMVYLTGTVKRREDGERAANIARSIEGVVGVNSSITLDEVSK